MNDLKQKREELRYRLTGKHGEMKEALAEIQTLAPTDATFIPLLMADEQTEAEVSTPYSPFSALEGSEVWMKLPEEAAPTWLQRSDKDRFIMLCLYCMQGATEDWSDKRLDLSSPNFHYKFGALADNFSTVFSGLKALDLSWNGLQTLPPEMGKFSQLTLLRASYNGISYVSNEVGKLASLNMLDLNHNHIGWLPDEIGDLSALTHLDVSCNRLQKLPKSLGQLSELKHLSLNINQLREIPASIASLSKLFSLDLRSNPLVQLPSELMQLTSLSYFKFDKSNDSETSNDPFSMWLKSMADKMRQTEEEEREDDRKQQVHAFMSEQD